MKTVAVKHISRVDGEIASRLGEIGTSSVHEAQGAHRPVKAIYAAYLSACAHWRVCCYHSSSARR